MLDAHAASWPVGFSHLVGQVHQVALTHASAAGLLGDFNRPGGIATTQADRVAAGAREDAAAYTPAEMLEQFSVTGRKRSASASWKPPSTCWTCSGPWGWRRMCPTPVWSTRWRSWPG
jgi:hypothetical protein